jgi:hypothetical protein
MSIVKPKKAEELKKLNELYEQREFETAGMDKGKKSWRAP